MRSTTKLTVIFSVMLAFTIGGIETSEAAPTLRASAMASAKTQKGAKYKYGGVGPYSKGYDCSGLVYWAYKKHGKKLPRVAADQYKKSKKVAASNRKPGDLIFIRDRKGRVYHVGIFTKNYAGKVWMLNANTGSYRGRKVVEAPINEYSGTKVYGRY
jgi:cell wall-associated NlpC family hydrolase